MYIPHVIEQPVKLKKITWKSKAEQELIDLEKELAEVKAIKPKDDTFYMEGEVVTKEQIKQQKITATKRIKEAEKEKQKAIQSIKEDIKKKKAIVEEEKEKTTETREAMKAQRRRDEKYPSSYKRLQMRQKEEKRMRDMEFDAEIQNVSRKLRRRVNRDLTLIPTPILAACVYRFLVDIKRQILPKADIEFFEQFREGTQSVGKGKNIARPRQYTEEAKKQMLEHLSQMPLYRQHTLAFLILHLHQISTTTPSFSKCETQDELMQPLREILPPIDILFNLKTPIWEQILTSTEQKD